MTEITTNTTENTTKVAIFDFSRTLAGSKGVYEGMAEQIVELREKGYKVALVSLAPRKEIYEELAAVPAKPGESLYQQFDPVIGSEGLQMINGGRADKTSRNVVNHVLAATGGTARNTVVVGDAFTELLMAKNGRLKYLHAGWDDPDKEGLKLGVDLDELDYDAVDVEMAESIPRVEQIALRIEAALEKQPTKKPEVDLGQQPDLDR